jgi:hypothetical protein
MVAVEVHCDRMVGGLVAVVVVLERQLPQLRISCEASPFRRQQKELRYHQSVLVVESSQEDCEHHWVEGKMEAAERQLSLRRACPVLRIGAASEPSPLAHSWVERRTMGHRKQVGDHPEEACGKMVFVPEGRRSTMRWLPRRRSWLDCVRQRLSHSHTS